MFPSPTRQGFLSGDFRLYLKMDGTSPKALDSGVRRSARGLDMTRHGVLAGILVFLTVIEASVLAHRVLFPYWPESLAPLASLEEGFYYAIAPISPILLIGVLFGRLLMVSVGLLIRKSRTLGPPLASLSRPMAQFISALRSIEIDKTAERLRILQHPRILLTIAAIVGAVFAYTPYRPDLNPSGNLVGVDSQLYVDWLGEMMSRPVDEAVHYAFAEAALGSRPLLLIPVYAISMLGGISPKLAIQSLPAALTPLLTLSTFMFVRRGVRSENAAGLAGVLAAFSFNLAVGMWGSYYANWLALAEAYLFLTILLSFSDSQSFPKFAVLTWLSLTILLTHPWTWVMILTVCVVFSITIWREGKGPSYTLHIVLLILVGLGADVLKNWILGPPTVATDLSTKGPVAGLHELIMIWPNVIDSLLFTHSGLLANSALLSLAILSLLALRFADQFQRLLVIWTTSAAVPFVFLDSYHQARIVYDLPIPILAAMGLVLLASLTARSRLRWPGLMVLLFILFSTNYAVRAMLQL